jgi:hypothetical protein
VKDAETTRRNFLMRHMAKFAPFLPSKVLKQFGVAPPVCTFIFNIGYDITM